MKKQSQNQLLAASEYYRRAAKKGSASAMFCLGKLYWNGQGVPRSRTTAVKYLTDAAQAGNVESMVMLGWVYYRGIRENNQIVVQSDLRKARKYYLMAAENGDDRSYYRLGVVCCDLNDYKAAMDYFKKAARIDPEGVAFADKYTEEQKAIRASRAAAMVRIGCLYREGKGGEGVNYGKAKIWFERAAALGDPSAMNNLSMMYAAGDGVPKDPAASEEWFKKYEKAAGRQ